MNLRNATLAAAVAATLGLLPEAGLAQQASNQPGQIKWAGSIYAKFLDGNRRTEQGLYSNADSTPGEGGGDQGQGIEFELLFNAQVSKQVEIGGRIHSRFNKNYWANYGGFAVPDNDTTNCGEDDPRCNQYIKLRGAWARITPGYEWIDSALIGNDDWGMFDPWTQGKSRYIDRDNIGGILLQGSALGKDLRWDVARVSLANYLGSQYSTGTFGEDIYTNDANYVGQLKYAPSPDWNATLIAMYARDKELENNDPNTLNGTGVRTAFDNAVYAVKGQYSGFDFVDISGAYYHSNFNGDKSTDANGTRCDTTWNGNCRFSPVPQEDASGDSFLINLNFNRLFLDGLSLNAQYFDISEDFVSITSARREADVLLTEGQEGTWAWQRPDYNFGNRGIRDSMNGLGWGGWNGEVQQVVNGNADNDFTDFDEPVAHSVIGWKGLTLIPKYQWNDWEFSGEYTYLDFNTNWQGCGGGANWDRACGKYFKNEGTNSWAYGGDFRSPYSPFQDRQIDIFALKAKYTLDFGNGIDLMARYKYISDEDDRVTQSDLLDDAYEGFQQAVKNPDWIPNIGLGGCVGCDDREVDYDTYGLSAGYQLTSDLYVTLIYELHEVELIDGTIDVAPVGLGYEGSNDFGFIEYVTGETTKNRLGLDFSYFLPGVEFGGTVDYLWGTYDPTFFTDVDGRRARLIPGPGVNTIATPLGNIPIGTVDYGQYRLKVFMKVKF